MIKNIKVLFDDPAMVEVEFEPLDQKIIDKIYAPENFQQLSFDNLVVNQGRQKLSTNGRSLDEYKILCNYFSPMYKIITKKLLELDKIRYPVFYDFDKWWERNNFDSKHAFMVVHDLKGFEQPYHLDNRFSMWAGSINLADNDTRTIFAHENHNWIHQGHNPEENFFQATGEKFKGTFWLNTENNWHGVPLVHEDRRAIVCNLLLAS